MQPSEVISIIALATSIAVGGTSTTLAIAANKRAKRAEANVERQRVDGLWANLISAAHDALTADTTAMDMRPILVNLRRNGSELSDGLPEKEWPQVDAWLQAEHELGTSLFHHAMLAVEESDKSVDAVLDAHKRSSEWCLAFLSNLRLMRRLGSTPETRATIPELRDNAMEQLEKAKGLIASLETKHSSNNSNTTGRSS